jgi:drug/metabolite transporter (DMT)-like permease
VIAFSSQTARPISVWTFILFTGFTFGAAGLISKSLINNGADAFAVTGFMFTGGSIIAWLVAITLGQVRRAALGAGLLLGALNAAIPALFFNIGYETLSAGLAVLLQSLSPVVTAGIAHTVFTDERFNPAKAIGLVIALTGIASLVLVPGVVEGASYRGAAWTVAGAVFAGGSGVMARKYAMRYGARALLAPQLTSAAIVPLLCGIALGRRLIPDGGFSSREILLIATLGVVVAFAGLRSLMLANEIGSTGQVSMVAYLTPIVGVTGGIIFFGESLTLWIVIGAVLIFAGVTVAGRASALSLPHVLPVSES